MAQLLRRVRRLPNRRVNVRLGGLAAALPLLLLHQFSLPRFARADSEVDAGSPIPMSPLPLLPAMVLPRATAKSREVLSTWSTRLTSASESEAFRARAQLRLLPSNLLPAVAERLKHLATHANKPALKDLLLEIRRVTRARLRSQMQATGHTGAVVTPDYLEMVLAHPGPPSEHLSSLREVLGYSRLLEAWGSAQAVTQLINIYVRFGEFLRVDTQLALRRLGDKSIAPLLRATRHPAPKIASWSNRQLEAQGRSSPGSSIAGLDPQQLPDVLRALGSIRSLESARLLLSYAASHKSPLRLAARQAITHLGHAGLWQLRDAYETNLGQRAPLEWPWDRLAQRLFAHHDRLRLQDLYRHYDAGRAAARKQHWNVATAQFDRVLAKEPGFEPQPPMARAYLKQAQQTLAVSPALAHLALQKAERLSESNSATHRQTQSLRYTVDVQRHLKSGWADQVLLHRALQLDPGNKQAKDLLARFQSPLPPSPTVWQRYAYTLSVALLTLLALALQVFQLRRRSRNTPPLLSPSPPRGSGRNL